MTFLQTLKSHFIKHPEEEEVLETVEEIMDEREERGDKVLVDSHELLLLKNLFKMKDVRASQVMIPRVDIVGIPDTITPSDLKALIIRDKFTRLPVYNKTLDNIIGILHVKDYLCAYLQNQDVRLNDIINHSILFVPASIRALDLLREMQAKKIQMSVVVDEYGGTDGLITLEDLLEVIVGEIEDEHDALDQTELISRPNETTILADAKADLKDIEIITGDFIDQEKLPEDIDTIGGYVFHLAGRLPHKGEVIIHQPSGIRLQVVDVDSRHIKKVKITRFKSYQKQQDKLKKQKKKKKKCR